MKTRHKAQAMLLALSFALALPACATEKSTGQTEPAPPAEEDAIPSPDLPETNLPETNPPETNPPAPPDSPDGAVPDGSLPEAPDNDNSAGSGSSGSLGSSGSSDSSNNTGETTPPPSQAASASYIICTGNDVNIRAGAGSAYSVLGKAEKGTMYAIIGKSGNWYKTFYKNKAAYINASYAKEFSIRKSDKKAVEDVLFSAYQLLGTPYVYGAVRYHDGYGNRLKNFTASKFDCSSLTQYAFYQGAGVLLQTTTRLQVKQGKYVKPSDLKRGDCIYFTNESRQYLTGIERVGHVAIYLGNNYILHTASDYARIEQISNARWNFYLEARRFL